MKKYNVIELYVIKADDYYFICTKTNKGYSEIFTKEEFKNIEDYVVEPLKNYYSLLAIMSYTTGEPLTLTKKELLKEYARINSANIERKKQYNAINGEFIKYQDEYIKALRELQEKNPQKAKELAIESLKKTGILDENEKLAYPYDLSLNNGIDKSEEYIKVRNI